MDKSWHTLDKKLLSSEAIISLPRMFSGLCRNLQMLQINGSQLLIIIERC